MTNKYWSSNSCTSVKKLACKKYNEGASARLLYIQVQGKGNSIRFHPTFDLGFGPPSFGNVILADVSPVIVACVV